jgi:NADH:ubiquinone oxidoreductase subunit E
MRRLAMFGAAAVVAISGFMIADQVRAMLRAGADAALVAALEERVKTDAAAAPELDAERERQTARSIARQARDHRLGYGLLAAAAVFLGAVNWGEPSPPQPPSPRGRGGSSDFPVSISPSPPGRGGRGVREPDLAFVDAVIAREGRGREAAILILQALQDHYRYLPEAALRRVCERTEVTAAQIAAVAGFYAHFRRTPAGRQLVRVCHGTACHVAGVDPVMDEMRRRLGIPSGDDTDPGRRFTLDPVACLGCCSLAPVMMVDGDVAGRLTPATACATLAAVAARHEEAA